MSEVKEIVGLDGVLRIITYDDDGAVVEKLEDKPDSPPAPRFVLNPHQHNDKFPENIEEFKKIVNTSIMRNA